jgi:proteasome accessory factor B
VPANASAKNPPEERLVNLVVALVATEQGLTKDTILSSVSGYREQSGAGASKDALEKMFERDKESLRRLGVPIETIGDWADPDDLREARYRIPTAEYELPEDIVFTSAELALLNLAGGVWSESSMSDQARSGLRKIRALGMTVDEPIIGYSPRISLRDPAFAALQQAIELSRVVTFGYLKPGEGSPRTRRVQPLALVEYEGRWHVFGVDLGVGAERTFLLQRIVDEVTITREPFDAALRDGAGERALAGLAAVAERNRALLEVTPGTEAALRLSRRALPADQGIRVPYVDVNVLADELASYGPEVRVVEPAELRAQVVARLEAAAPPTEESHDRPQAARGHRPSRPDAAARALPDRQGRGVDRRGRRRIRRHGRSDARHGGDPYRDRPAR